MATDPEGPHETPIARGTLPSGRPYTLTFQINLQIPGASEEPLSVEDRAYLLDVVWPAARQEAIAALQTLPRFRGGWAS
jgi:hypothetical protein